MSFNKLFSIFRNKTNQAIDSLAESSIDIKREGNSLIASLDSKINKLTNSVVDVQKNIQLYKSKIETNALNIHAGEKAIRKLLVSNNEEEAKRLLLIINSNKSTNTAYQSSIDTLQPIVDDVIANINILKAEKLSLKDEIMRLDIEEQTYKIKQELLGSVCNNSTIDLTYLRERVSNAKAKYEATEIINSQLNTDINISKDVESKSLEEQLEEYRTN